MIKRLKKPADDIKQAYIRASVEGITEDVCFE